MNLAASATAGWFNGDWHYRVRVSVNKAYVNGTLANFPVYVNLAGLNGTSFFTHVNSDGSDIVVTKDDGTTRVAREIASINRTSQTGELYFQANGASLSNSTNGDFYIYYNNSTATEPTANGTYAKERVWDSNYIGVWHFAGDPVIGTYDSTSNNYDCTAYGGLNGNNLIAGKVNFALLFNGAQQQYVSCGITTALQSKTKVSLSAWFKRRNASSNVSLGASNISSNTSGLGIHSSAGNINSTIGGSNNFGAYASNDTNWHQVHWLFNGASISGNSGRLQTYFDGSNVTLSYTGTVAATTYSSFNSPFAIGYIYNNPTSYFTNGYWDEIRLSNALRSNDWAKTEYNNLNSPSTFYTLATIEQVTDVKVPILLGTSTPTDNSSGVRYNTHLTLIFNEYVDTQSGNIYIKKSSDNSTVQIIAINSSAVTGNGTTTLMVNLNDLMSNNGYYVQIDNTAIYDLAGNAYAGINDTTTWNFTTETIGTWYNGDWHYRMKVNTIHDYVNGDLTNFPVYINLATLNGTTFFSNVLTNGADIRVTKIDGTTQVAREVVFLNTTSRTGELYFVANGTLSGTYNGSYYIYYNNPIMTEPTANGAYAKEKVWSTGYVGVWHFSSDPYVKTYDSTSNNYDCTAYGGLNGSALVSGRVGNALLFNGTQQQYVDCGFYTPLQNKTKLSMSAWFKRRNTSSVVSLGAFHASTGMSGVGIYSAAGNINSTIGGSSNLGAYASNDTNWHQVHWLYNGSPLGSSNRLKTYFDGSHVSLSYTGTVAATSYPTLNSNFMIGYLYNNPTSNFTNGYWDEVRVSNVLRSYNWAKAEYNNLNSPTTFSTLSLEQTTDTKAPALYSASPADNSTGVRYNTNLTMTFLEFVDTQSGNIYIKKSSDNSTVQTIAANSSAVTGNGTHVLTVNLNDLMSNNGYYVQIDNTAIKDLAGNAYAGISDTTTWNFSTETIGTWYNGDWHYRVKVNTVHNYINGDLTNFPVYVNLALLNGTSFFSNVNSDGSDIRVTKIDGTTQVAREIVSINTTSKTGELYFQANGTLSSIYNGSYYIYYNNPLATEPTANGTYAKEKVWDSNYIGVWHFAGDPAVSTYDSTSNNYDCTAYGGLNGNNLVAGKIGSALIFNGTQSQYVYCGIGVALQSKTKLGLSGWFKRRNASSNVSLGASGSMGNYGVGIYSPGSANINSAAYAPQAYGAYASNDTNWHQVHWLYNGSLMGNSNRLRTYFDGSNVSLTYTGTAPTATISTFTNAFSIGTLYVNPSIYYTNGYWDEVRLSSIARSNNWIKTEYNNLNSPATFMGLAVETVNDTKIPVPLTLSPADNSTSVRYNTNLTMTFLEFVDTQSGNIYIKKSSDNSTVQTIAANSVSVTGNGTNVLTVDISDLAGNNGFYVQIDSNAIKDLFGNYYAGINDTTTWNFTTHGLNNWFNGDWHYRIKVTTNTNYVNGDLSNYPFYVDLSSFNGTNFFSALNADGSDIRVTKIDGTTQVAREVSFVNRASETGELYFVANGTLSKTYGDSFYVYYGNPLATEPTANGSYAKERVWDSNYIGVWHLSEGGYFDSTSNNYDCSAGGGINGNNLVTGRIGTALLFNGAQSQYIGCGVYTAINSKTKLSMSTWFKRRAASATMSSTAKGGGSNEFGLSSTSTNINILLNTNTTPPTFASNDTNWHSLQWLFNGSQISNNTRLKAYYDGSLQTLTFPAAVVTSTGTYQSAWAFSIGSAGGLGSYTNGYWDEMRLSSATRSPNWVKTEYNNLNSPSTFYGFTAAEQYSADVIAPAIVSFNPADNATNARTATNLVLNFNDFVDTQTGTNLYIKKSSDDSTVQTVSLTSLAVTGNGTSTLTVDINDLMSNNGYYVQIDNNAIKDLSGNVYAGINDTTTWNFTTRTTGNWFNGSWLYRTQIITNNAKVNGTSLTNFPIYVDLAHLSSTNMFNLTKADGSDIRITKDDGITQVAREIAYFNATTNAGEMYFVANGTLSGTEDETFYIYYGNAGATEPTANGSYAKERVWDSGYLGVWHMTTDPSVSTYDSTSNNYDCSQTGSMTSADLVTGKVNYALNFDGTNDYVSCGITSALQNKAVVSMSGWLKRRALAASMAAGASPSSGSAGVGIIAYSTLTYFAPYGQYNSASVPKNDLAWHYVSWAFDGSKTGDAARLKTYMDGLHQAPTYSTIPATTYASAFTYPFRIGYIYDGNLGGNMFSNGYWDEVRLSNVVRSSDWTKTEYNNLNSPSTFYSIGAINKGGNPGVTSFSPVDNGIYAAIDTNLVINFDEAVTLQSGNIYIKKTSDDSTVETITIGGPRVSLSSFNQVVTIDPVANFANNNGYYVQIDANAFKDSTDNGYAGIANTSTWNFTTVPVISSDWLQGGIWDKRLKIEVNKSMINGSVANYPVFVNLANLPSTFFDDVANNGVDIRITKSDGVTQVAREVVWLNKTQNAGELHFIANGTMTNSANGVFYLYYKNSYATEPTASSAYGKYNTWNQAGYAGVWHLNESPASAATLYNSASSSYNCTSYGSMLASNRIAGPVGTGNGTSFDGTNDYLDCGDVTELNSVTKFTLSGWAKRTAADIYIATGSKYLNASNNLVSAFYSSAVFSAINTLSSSNYSSGGGINDTAWHHLVMSFNGNLSGNSNRLVTYNNGNNLGLGYTGTVPATTAALADTSFYIGRDPLYVGYGNGRLDEIRVSRVMRNGSWVRTEYRNQSSPSTFYTVSSVNLYTNLVLLSLSPFDGSTSAGADENLVMTFDRKIDLQTGNIYIKKSSDNSIVETISVSGGLVTGNGTSQITINPAGDLARGNGYYVQIDATALDDTGGNSYAGINDTTTWNFTTSYWYNGSWTKRIKVTVNSPYVNGSVSNFPVYVRMSDLPAAFYDEVANNGADLRVTKGNGSTEVAREVVWLNKTQNAGELYFVANGAMTNAANTDFYIYYKNPYVTEPSASATYGKYNTWAASGYAAVWHLNESPTGTLYNSASASYNCTSSGSMVIGNRIAGQLAGNGTSFDGSNDYLNCGDVTQLNSTTKYTITGWMKRTASSGFMSMFNKYSNSSNVISTDFYSTTFYGITSSSGGSTLTATNNDTSWHHIAMIFNGNLSGNANRMNAYNNGALMSLSFSGTIPASTANLSSVPVYIGRDDYAGPYGNGRADEVRVVNLARNGSWVKTEYYNQNSPNTFYTVSAIESIPDTVAPTVLTFLPADNYVGAAATANLVITFDEPVDTQAGNIYIKKSSDDSLIETIVANSGLVTGNGTTQITVNPNTTFADNTGYYVQIDSGVITDTAGNSYVGIANTSTWNFATSAWYNSNWTRRIPVTINAAYVNGSVTNFPVYVNLNGMPASFTSDILANGADLRVTKSDGTTEVAREIVFVNRTTNAGELYFVANGTMTNAASSLFYIYYKNSGATEPAATATYGKYNTWASSGYAGVWHLNESPASAATLYNSASASYNCTSAGAMLASNRVSGAAALSGNGTSFDGSNDYLTCGDITQLNSTTKFTVTGWGKRTSSSALVSLFNKYSSSSNLITTDLYAANFYGIVGNAGAAIGTAANNDTNWHHIAMIFNGNLSGNANRFNAYNNGTAMSLSFSGTVPASVPNLSGTSVYIGRDDYTGPYMNGRLDEIRVVALARTGSWIKTEYNNQFSPTTFYTLGAAESTVDTQAPSMVSLSPADNSIGVSTTANLVITFDEAVDTQVGNIYIKKTSDDSIFETIVANSGLVTGNGTIQLTINPAGTFASDTTYYVQIQNTAIKDIAGNSYAGISSTTAWNFSTPSWYSSSWNRRIPITINATYINGSVTNFPVFVNLNGMPASFTSDVLANGADLRVTKSDGSTEVAREIVFLNRTTNAGELHFVANGTMTNSANTTFYIYYKNSSATEPSASASYGKYNVWAPNGYVGVWHLNESPASAATLYNSASASYNCTSSGAMVASNRVSAAGGLAGNGTSFDGSNDYLDCGDVNELDSVSKFTITGWGKRTSAGNHVILGAKFTNASARIESWYYTDGNYYNIVGTGTYGYATKNDTNWHHTAMIYNGNLSTNATRAVSYIDGAPLTHTYSGTIPATSSNHSGNFMMSRSAAGNYTNGRLDEIRVSSVARTPNWVKTEYNNQNSPNTFYTIGSADIYVDTSPPTISILSPADNATGVALDANLVITFSKAIDIQTGNIYIKKLSDNSTAQTIAMSSGLLSGNGTTQITINPSTDLDHTTSYYINIDATAFDDTAGNSYAGMTGNGTWNFTTIGDLTAPTISSFSPADNTTGVPVASNLVMNFSEAVNVQTGNFVIYNSGGSIFETIDIAGGLVSGTGTSAITINPTSNLADYSTYYVLVNSGVIQDLAGNSYAGISLNSTWNFTTDDLNAPTVMNYSPPHTSILQQRYAGLRIVFNEAVQKGIGTIVIKQVSNDSTVASVNVASSTVIVNGNQLYVQMPEKLPEGTEFYIQLSPGIVKDLSNNDYAGVSNTSTWRFSTSASENSLFL